jgi:hypothetical protein
VRSLLLLLLVAVLIIEHWRWQWRFSRACCLIPSDFFETSGAFVSFASLIQTKVARSI